jgi:hypothetical protein
MPKHRQKITFAEMAGVRAVPRGREREFNSGRKDAHWGKRRPKKDRERS